MNAPATASALAAIGREARRLIDGHGPLYDLVVYRNDGTKVCSNMPAWMEDRDARMRRVVRGLRRRGNVAIVELIPLGNPKVRYTYPVTMTASECLCADLDAWVWQ